MDIKARIEEMIAQRGLTKREVSERMGKFNQAFNSLITNPKWDTIELVAEALCISTKELLYGSKNIQEESTSKDNDCNDDYSLTEQSKNTKTFGLLECPHCGKCIKICAKL